MNPGPPADGEIGARDRRRVGRKLALARAVVLWERLWPALWPAAGIAGLFVALSLLNVWASVGGWVHLAALLLFAGAFGAALWRGLSGLSFPDRGDARRLLETPGTPAAGLLHRPLTALEDTLATDDGDDGARALWRLHRRRALAGVRGLRIGVPSPGLARSDVLALRAVVVLLLVVAVAVAGGESGRRLASGMVPGFAGDRAAAAVVEAWIAPPAYTGLPPVLLDPSGSGPPAPADPDTSGAPPDASGSPQTVRVPAGSEVLAKVSGGGGPPVLDLDGRAIPFAMVEPEVYELRAPVDSARRMAIGQPDRELGVWELDIVPDMAPTVAFEGRPAGTRRAALRVDYSAGDDYGLAAVTLEIRLAATGRLHEIGFVLPGPDVKTHQDTVYRDLTPHAWAGLPVRLRLRADDRTGRSGFSETFDVTLPERRFRHPVARAVIEQRKRLASEPEALRDIARALGAIASGVAAGATERHDDYGAFLALNSARRRLERGAVPGKSEEEVVDDVRRMLWDTALRIEDGALSVSEREVRALEQALLEALARDAPSQEIERLMNELREALDRYLQALAQQALQAGEDTAELRGTENDVLSLTRDDLQRLLDRARELSRAGSRDAARELLSQLRDILENLRAGVMSDRQRDARRRGQQTLRDLGDLMTRQQQLLDRSFRRTQRGMQGTDDAPGSGRRGARTMPDARADARVQDSLRRMLGEVMRRLGENDGNIPEALGEGELSMRAARDALSRDRNDEAIGPQTRALEQLREGAGAVMQRMLSDIGMDDGPMGDDVDPLGRPMPGASAGPGDDVEVPDKASLRRAGEILGELRRRAGQRTRPPPELDYIDRLLRRF